MLNYKFRCKEERRISGGVHVEEPTLKEHYAPRFNSMHIESTKDQIWFRANAAQIYKRSSVESGSLSSRVKASP